MYINSCPQCQKNKTSTHKLYRQLQPISSLTSPCEMITMDFITKLPPSRYDNIVFSNTMFDTILIITDKLSKMVTLIPGREDWNATVWAQAFYDNYYKRWGMPR